MPRPRPGSRFYTASEIAQHYWDAQLRLDPAVIPGRNQMEKALRPLGLGREQARRDWEHLHWLHHGGDTMAPQETITTDGETAVRLARVEAHIARQAREDDARDARIQAIERQQQADRATLAKVEELLLLLGSNEDAWPLVVQTFRHAGFNGRGPLLELLTTLVGRPALKPF